MIFCDGCGDLYFPCQTQEEELQVLELSLADGWTTDGIFIHCDECEPLETTGIFEARAMHHKRSVAEMFLEDRGDDDIF